MLPAYLMRHGTLACALQVLRKIALDTFLRSMIFSLILRSSKSK